MAENYGPWIIGGAVALILAKAAIDAVPSVPNPLPYVRRGAIATIEAADEVTGGIQGDPRTTGYWFNYDVPFSDVEIPLAPGLVKDPDESWPQYLFGVDVPGRSPINPAASVYDAGKTAFRKVWR